MRMYVKPKSGFRNNELKIPPLVPLISFNITNCRHYWLSASLLFDISPTNDTPLRAGKYLYFLFALYFPFYILIDV